MIASSVLSPYTTKAMKQNVHGPLSNDSGDGLLPQLEAYALPTGEAFLFQLLVLICTALGLLHMPSSSLCSLAGHRPVLVRLCSHHLKLTFRQLHRCRLTFLQGSWHVGSCSASFPCVCCRPHVHEMFEANSMGTTTFA